MDAIQQCPYLLVITLWYNNNRTMNHVGTYWLAMHVIKLYIYFDGTALKLAIIY